MKKAELIALAEKYHMEFLRHEITNERAGVYCESTDLIPELDELVAQGESAGAFENIPTYPVFANREQTGVGYHYDLYCPKKWIDLYGWTE